jgi:hypothetical protein
MELKTTKILGITEEEMLKMKSVRFYRTYIVPEIKKVGADNFKETELGIATKEDRDNLKQLRKNIYEKHNGDVYGTENYTDYKNAKKFLQLLNF